MSNKIKTDIKRFIRLNLEDRISQILFNKDKIKLLSKRDIISIVNFMKKEGIYSKSILEYIYLKSISRYCSELSLHDLDNDILIVAAEKGNINVVKFLLSNEIRTLYPNIDPSASNNYAIRHASQNGHIDVVKFLLSDEIRTLYPSINPSAHYNYAIRYASKYGHIEVLKFLLSSEILKLYPRIDPCTLNNDPIRLAYRFCHTEVVEFLRIHVYNSASLSDIIRIKI